MNNLRYLRKTRTKLTMKQLGEIVGVSESAIWNYEAGKREPDYEMLLKLSEAIGCSVADIMEDSQSPIDEELAEALQILKDNPKTRGLLRVTKGLTPEQVESMTEMILKLKEG